MSVVLNKGTAEWILQGEYEINRIHLQRVEETHTHQFIEIVYTYQGKGRHRINDRDYYVGHGDLLLIDYHSRHTVEPIENFKYVDIMLKPEYINENLRGSEDALQLFELYDFSDFDENVLCKHSLIHFDGDERKKIESLIEWTEEEQKKKAPGSELMKHSALNLLLSMILRKMTEQKSGRLAVNDALIAYIERNCAEQLRQDELAAKCFYSPAHFARTFKKYTGMTFKAYVRACRVKKAEKLLSETDMHIERIVSECGFSNRTAFFKSFFDVFGQTPLQYRKNQK